MTRMASSSRSRALMKADARSLRRVGPAPSSISSPGAAVSAAAVAWPSNSPSVRLRDREPPVAAKGVTALCPVVIPGHAGQFQHIEVPLDGPGRGLQRGGQERAIAPGMPLEQFEQLEDAGEPDGLAQPTLGLGPAGGVALRHHPGIRAFFSHEVTRLRPSPSVFIGGEQGDARPSSGEIIR